MPQADTWSRSEEERESSDVHNVPPMAKESTADDSNDRWSVITADGKIVYNRWTSHVSHYAAHMLKEAISRINTKGEQLVSVELDLERIIGYSIVVPISPKDDIVWRRRLGRRFLSPIVRGRKPLLTRYYTANLLRKKENHNEYVLISAWIGRKTELEPGDVETYYRGRSRVVLETARRRSRAFWRTHAFVYQCTPLMPLPEDMEGQSLEEEEKVQF